MKVLPHANLSDQELLEHFYHDGNNDWLGILLQRYTLMLFGVGMKYLKNEDEAKDVVQQVFLKSLHEIPKYRITYFKSWLYTLAKNHCLMQLRVKPTLSVSENHYTVTFDEPKESDYFDQQHKLEKMQIAIGELNEEQRYCITLFYLKKKSYKEVSEITGFNIQQVKSFIQNGKRNLKIKIQNMDGDE
ncbi:MAG: sigma-70 family RNA polymerase sigma factor [Ferruginibacter sp.]|nr:sigma-70 family RNA polymerase sigma factor [Ferruginibacter sp.]